VTIQFHVNVIHDVYGAYVSPHKVAENKRENAAHNMRVSHVSSNFQSC
jgi:hypothetical protein